MRIIWSGPMRIYLESFLGHEFCRLEQEQNKKWIQRSCDVSGKYPSSSVYTNPVDPRPNYPIRSDNEVWVDNVYGFSVSQTTKTSFRRRRLFGPIRNAPFG